MSHFITAQGRYYDKLFLYFSNVFWAFVLLIKTCHPNTIIKLCFKFVFCSILVSCGTVPEVKNGSFSIATNGSTSTAEFNCETGYSITGDTTIQCDSNGLWESTFPECGEL